MIEKDSQVRTWSGSVRGNDYLKDRLKETIGKRDVLFYWILVGVVFEKDFKQEVSIEVFRHAHRGRKGKSRHRNVGTALVIRRVSVLFGFNFLGRSTVLCQKLGKNDREREDASKDKTCRTVSFSFHIEAHKARQKAYAKQLAGNSKFRISQSGL